METIEMHSCCPSAVIASLAFAPEIVLPTARHLLKVSPQIAGKYCLKCSFNLPFLQQSDGKPGWTSMYRYGINLGPVTSTTINTGT